MRKTLKKEYPVFDTIEKYINGTSWFRRGMFNIPNRFGSVHYKDHVSRERENFVAFGCDVMFSDESSQMTQEAYFFYDQPIYLRHPYQLEGNKGYDGNVDFYVTGVIAMDNGSVLQDPATHRGIRYPFKMASYYPIRNVLICRGLLGYETNQSIKDFIKWMFEKIEGIGYKYNVKGEALLIGCDPEFSVLDMLDERVRADTLFPTGSYPRIGCDGHAQTGELRPEPADCPLKLTDNIRQLMNDMTPAIGTDKKVATGGGGEIDPLGHHIHFNKMICSEELELLDLFVGRPSLNIKGAKRPSGNYDRLGTQALRAQPHGCEYRAPASSLTPELSNALHVTAWCVVKKWESLSEGESFDIEVDDENEIPTLDSYLSLDVTEDERHKPHLKEFWSWVTRQPGKALDPYRDILHMWVEGRREVKPEPGIKINWSNTLYEDDNKDLFVSIPEFDKIHTINIFLLPTSAEDSSSKLMQVCLPDDMKAQVNMQELARVKTKYGIDRMLGFDHTNVRLGVTQALVDHISSYRKFKKMVVDIAKVICV